ncbi:MAG: hypothetical protein EXS69_02560, partial [Candidatus Zambryskibacteria bacterium]|nr:hypothetical protein [Candidatus Zambryskibacteria bacterium]
MSEDLDQIEAAKSSSKFFIALKNGWVLGLNAAIIRINDFEMIENISKIILHAFGADPLSRSNDITNLAQNKKVLSDLKLTEGLGGGTTFSSILAQIESRVNNTPTHLKKVASIAILSCIYGSKRVSLTKTETLN